MRSEYKAMLDCVAKGNAVMAEIEPKYWFGITRYRIITPNSCEYTTLDGSFEKSCFFGATGSTTDLMMSMDLYDKRYCLELVDWQVL